MFLTHPLSLPRSLHLTDMDGPDAYSNVEHLAVDVADSGDRYVLTWFRQLSTGCVNALAAQIVSRYQPNGELAGRLVLHLEIGKIWEERKSGIRDRVSDLCVLPDGTVAVSSSEGRTFLLDAELKGMLGSWEGAYRTGSWDEVSHNGGPRPTLDITEHVAGCFASAIRTTPAGRLLCVVPSVTEPNLIGVAEGPLTAEHRPTVKVVRALLVPGERLPSGHRVHDSDILPAVPHTEYRGAPVGPGNRPVPGIVHEVEERLRGKVSFQGLRPLNPRLEAYTVVAEDRFVVPLFESFRPDRWSKYVYNLMDETGALVGELESPGFDDASPVPGERHAVAADPARGRIYHVNRSGLYVWNADGKLLTTLPTTDKAYRGLKQLKLMACAPDGSLALVRQEHNLLLNIDIPDDLDALGPAVAEALADHTRRRNRLKKEWNPTDWRWLADEDTTAYP